MTSLELNLVDAIDTSRDLLGKRVEEVCLFGRDPRGESVCVFVQNTPVYIYLAAAADWIGGRVLERDLDDHLLKKTRPWCSRTLCPCTACKVCGHVRQKCVCPCRKCPPDLPCSCGGMTVHINSDMCAFYRKADTVAVLGVESVYRKGFIGFESADRLFYKIRLARPGYVSAAKKFLWGLDTGLPEHLAGAYGATPSGVDGFMRGKRATGYCWLAVANALPAEQKRSRCAREYTVAYDHVELSPDQSRPAAVTRLGLDAETLSQRGFSDVDPIGVMAMRTEAFRVVHVVAGPLTAEVTKKHPDYPINIVKDEAALLLAVCATIKDADADVIEGYNIISFDIPRILRRCEVLGVAADFSRLVCAPVRCMKTVTTRGKDKREATLLDCPGRVFLDSYVQILPKNLRDNRLGKLGKQLPELGLTVAKGDVEPEQIYPLFHGSADERGTLVEYCCYDVDLEWELGTKLKMCNDVVANSQIKKCLPRMALTRGQNYFFECLVRAHADGVYLLPDYLGKHDAEEDFIAPLIKSVPVSRKIHEDGFEGGEVQAALAGLWRKPVMVVDFVSLYPSIMRKYNLCNSTFLGDEARARALGFAREQCFVTPEGVWFVRPEVAEGLLPKILRGLFDLRVDAKRTRDSFAKGSVDWDIWHARQEAIKVSANSLYGACGLRANKFGNMSLAASVTHYGRDNINAVKAWVEAEYTGRVTVLYGDTDSLMIMWDELDALAGFDVDKDPMTPEIHQAMLDEARVKGREMVRRINKESGIFQAPMELDFEKVYVGYLLMCAKRYAGSEHSTKPGDRTPGKLCVKGLECKRSDAAPFSAAALSRLLQLMLVDKASDVAIAEFVREKVAELLEGRVPFDDLVLSNKLSRPVDEYTGPNPHVVAARDLKQAGIEMLAGQRVQYVFVERPEAKKVADRVLALRLMKDEKLDLRFYLSKFIEAPFRAALSCVLSKAALGRLLRPGDMLKSVRIEDFVADPLPEPAPGQPARKKLKTEPAKKSGRRKKGDPREVPGAKKQTLMENWMRESPGS